MCIYSSSSIRNPTWRSCTIEQLPWGKLRSGAATGAMNELQSVAKPVRSFARESSQLIRRVRTCSLSGRSAGTPVLCL
jgi:hypothetical protein